MVTVKRSGWLVFTKEMWRTTNKCENGTNDHAALEEPGNHHVGTRTKCTHQDTRLPAQLLSEGNVNEAPPPTDFSGGE